MKYCIDANALITPWHITHKPSVFPSLWKKLVGVQNSIILIKPIFDEIEPALSWNNLSPTEKTEKYPIRFWLIKNEFQVVKITGEIENISLQLEYDYQVNPDSKGASKNDIRLISYAQQTKNCVVTLEEQVNLPSTVSRYKIPSICKPEKVKCINFIKMLEELGIRI